MNGETFGGLFTILPDQMQVANPVLILLFIPLFDYVIYPMLSKFIRLSSVLFPNISSEFTKNYLKKSISFSAKCNICKTDLQRIVAGGLLAAVSFIVSGCLELELQVYSFMMYKDAYC